MLIETPFSLLALAATYTAVAWAPGPNVLLVRRASVFGPRTCAAVALGIAVGAALLAGLILEGLAAFALPMEAGIALTLLYGAVLLRAGLCCLPLFRWRMTQEPRTAEGLLGHFRTGLAAGVTNPLTAAFFVGASAGVLGENAPLAPAAGAATTFVIALAGFGTLGLFLSSLVWRERFERLRPVADWSVSLLLLAIGWSAVVDAGLRWSAMA